jgi:hypothetical protein
MIQFTRKQVKGKFDQIRDSRSKKTAAAADAGARALKSRLLFPHYDIIIVKQGKGGGN